MALPSGAWTLNANGFVGDLTVVSVDANGNLNATVFGGQQTIGFWDDVSQRISFIRVSNPNDPSTIQVYTGYLFQNRSGNNATYTLAGFFEAFAGTGANAQRVVYGWYAQITLKDKEKEKEKDKEEQKDSKDTKDHKDIKDNKESVKEKVKDKEIVKELERPTAAGSGGGFVLGQPEAVVQPTENGQAFIRATERPAVGRHILEQSERPEE